ncbi:ATP-dependent DNA helicase DinG [Pseudomonas saponiphila]|uniref:ATP-dependent DNA helicase DinG n=1 Tax=Pseudomonas saponiphila TaxID=556534 RepID=A0A1H4ZC79_9PSED|nr:ATP-dependent DNA helicase [Pseudomonas saponiphila]SED27713.1 ATP-dependent DNA helicase DinG [Pseudomonas saponiphila]
MDDLEKRLLHVVDSVLGPNGRMVRGRSGDGEKRTYRYNSKQHEFAKVAARGFCRYDEAEKAAAVNMLQGATGTGKTLGYLVPAFAYAALTGERVIVSTFTKALQQQIINNDAPRAQRWVNDELGVIVRYARRVGRSNYLSLSSCLNLKSMLDSKDDDDVKAFVNDLTEWLKRDHHTLPTVEDYLSEVGNGCQLPAGLDAKSLCLCADSPTEEIEAYELALEESHNADVLIVNHALVMLDASRWTKILNPSRPASILICDEADRMTDAAESVLGADVSMHRFNGLTQSVADAFNLPDITGCVGNLYSAVQSIDPGTAKMAALNENIAKRIDGVLSALEPHVAKFAGMLSSPQGELEDHSKALLADFCDSYNDLANVQKASRSKGNTSIISWSPVRHFPSLRVGHPEPARIITRMLAPMQWDGEDNEDVMPPRSYLRAALFTSATLATPGRSLPIAFDAFADSIGVVRHCKRGMTRPIHNVTADLYRIFDAPPDFGEMFFVLPAPNAPLPTGLAAEDEDYATASNPAWLDYAAAMVREAAAGDGKTLVLTLSHADTQAIGERLKDLDGLIVAKPGDNMSMLKQQYQSRDNAVMITPGGWEGLDLPGEVQNLVITRLPFGSINSFRLSLKEAVLRHRGYSDDKIQSIKFAELNADARRRLVQGLGRGIRQRSDRVEVWIGDPRFPYPASFATALDDVLMIRRPRVLKAFSGCIPERFEDSFNASRIFLTDGSLHTAELV